TYFDPIGLRLSFDARRVRVETHILPLAGSEQYRSLRELAGRGKFNFEARTEAVVDFRLSLGEQASIAFHVDQNACLREMVELLIRWETDPRINLRQEYDRLFWKLPLGVGLRGTDEIARGAEGVLSLLRQVELVKAEPTVSRYKEVTIHRAPISEEKYRQLAEFLNQVPEQTPFATLLAVLPRQEAPPALHVADIDKVVYVSANVDFIRKLIDQAELRTKLAGRRPAEPAREANAALFISPANAGAAASLFLEYEGSSVALLNNQVWNAFYQT